MTAGPRRSFFVPERDSLVPEPSARGYWGATLHGRLIGGLTARAVETARAKDAQLVCTRMTIDLFRPALMAPVQVSSRAIREGRRIRVLEVTVEQDAVAVGQGKAVLLRRGPQPTGRFPTVPVWDGPSIGELGEPRSRDVPATAQWTPPWDRWVVPGDDGHRGGMWIREHLDLVLGEPITPLIRLALAADFSSPIANMTTGTLQMINADYTIYLGREPVGEHIGVQLAGRVGGDGIAVAQCVVHDADGPVGFVATAAVANGPPRRS